VFGARFRHLVVVPLKPSASPSWARGIWRAQTTAVSSLLHRRRRQSNACKSAGQMRQASPASSGRRLTPTSVPRRRAGYARPSRVHIAPADCAVIGRRMHLPAEANSRPSVCTVDRKGLPLSPRKKTILTLHRAIGS
jgi:hypothetical protein